MRYRELTEARAMIRGRPVLLLKNPSPDILFFHLEGFRQGIARGILIEDEAYFFDAYLATHEDIETFFGVPESKMGFDIAERGVDHYGFAAPDGAMAALQANRCVARMLSDPRIEVIEK